MRTNLGDATVSEEGFTGAILRFSESAMDTLCDFYLLSESFFFDDIGARSDSDNK